MAKKEKIAVKKGVSSFSMVGKACISEYTYSIGETSSSGFIYNRLNLGVDCGNGNIVYAEMMGGYNPEKSIPLYVHGRKSDGKDDYKNRIEVSWEDRQDPSITKLIGRNCFTNVALYKDKNNSLVEEGYISQFDAIARVKELLTSGTTVRVSGNLEYSYYKGTVKIRKKITRIELSDREPSDFYANFTQSLLVSPDSFGKVDKNGFMSLYCRVIDYVAKYNDVPVKRNVSMPTEIKIDTNELGEAQTKTLVKYLMPKKNMYSEICIVGNLVEGAETKEITMSDLPDAIQELLKLGLISEEEVKQKAVVNSKEKKMVYARVYITKASDDKPSKAMVEKDKYKIEEIETIEELASEMEAEEDVQETPVEIPSMKTNYNDDDVPFDIDSEDESLTDMLNGLFG